MEYEKRDRKKYTAEQFNPIDDTWPRGACCTKKGGKWIYYFDHDVSEGNTPDKLIVGDWFVDGCYFPVSDEKFRKSFTISSD